MTITAHAGWTLNPVSTPNATITHSLPLASQTYNVFGGAVDSASPSASFTFAWSILLPRTGQTASLSSSTAQNPTLQNVNDIWGDLRLFLVATNPATGETSVTDPKIAPASAFCTLQIESAARSLRLPAIGSRDWYTALDTITHTLDTLTINNGITSATVNGAGELIITLSDGNTINAGVVKGADGTNGANGTNGTNGATGPQGPAGPSQRILTYTAHVTHWYDLDSTTLQAGLNPAKPEPIAGPWYAPLNMTIQQISVSVRNSGAQNNSATFNLFTTSQADWKTDQLTSDSNSATITSTANNSPQSHKITPSNLTLTAGDLFGIEMTAPSSGVMHGIAIAIVAQET